MKNTKESIKTKNEIELKKKEAFIKNEMNEFLKLQEEIQPFIRKDDIKTESTSGEWIECTLI